MLAGWQRGSLRSSLRRRAAARPAAAQPAAREQASLLPLQALSCACLAACSFALICQQPPCKGECWPLPSGMLAACLLGCLKEARWRRLRCSPRDAGSSAMREQACFLSTAFAGVPAWSLALSPSSTYRCKHLSSHLPASSRPLVVFALLRSATPMN